MNVAFSRLYKIKSVGIGAAQDMYKHASFGTQLVLKTKAAENCIHHIDAYFYNKNEYENEYKKWWYSASCHYSQDIQKFYSMPKEKERKTCDYF